ncbi:MAG: hypothetical protein ACOC5I_00270 [Gemmatimonadota bacterium]
MPRSGSPAARHPHPPLLFFCLTGIYVCSTVTIGPRAPGDAAGRFAGNGPDGPTGFIEQEGVMGIVLFVVLTVALLAMDRVIGHWHTA